MKGLPTLESVDTEELAVCEAYPYVVMAGPVFGYAMQVDKLAWRLLSNGMPSHTPQEERDSLRAHLYGRGTAEPDPDTSKEYIATALKLDWERHDELTVADRRFRIVRGDQFVCVGPEGPKPPRPADPDPAGEHWRHPSDDKGRLIHATVPSGRLAILLGQGCIPLVPSAGTVPTDIYRDARRAAKTYANFMLLAATFTAAEQIGAGWEQCIGVCRTPRWARETLASHLRGRDGTADGCERATEALERNRRDEVVVRDRRFRIARVETVLYFAADGPEPPRPSDHDPYPPPDLQMQQLREADGLVGEPDDQG
ncbi:DUF5954 family protein [Nonomuraea insulae]|uniref:DUF5954 family protein n=1 Tax=Nonomuraea insulae TaxID=1616787 RepID=A0ABW1CRW0_9ACTN